MSLPRLALRFPDGYDRPVRIAVDARALAGERTGVGRYLEGLVSAWLDLFPDDGFHLLSPRPIDLPAALRGRVAADGHRSKLPGTVWLQAAAGPRARSLGADLFFGPLGILPLAARLPGVATVHDLTPLLFPGWHGPKNRLGFAPLIGPTVRVARRLVCVSEATRRDLVARFPRAEGKSAVVHNGVLHPAPRPGPGPATEPFVLSLGTVEPRKNLVRLVEAMESIWDRRPGFPRLVVAGGMGWRMERFPERLTRSRHAGRIRWLGYVTPDEAQRLLATARLLAYPSLYEGFGLPPLEAMAAGTPVVASSSSSLPEVVGDAGLLPDPTDTAALAAALERAEDDEAWRLDAVAKGRARSALFTWEASARATRRLFEEALA